MAILMRSRLQKPGFFDVIWLILVINKGAETRFLNIEIKRAIAPSETWFFSPKKPGF
ncbi:MAG TPA: hypothetical protein V6C58_06115 [Allocoleopsis sp.]